jgi:ketosteroid isomerase-like protein
MGKWANGQMGKRANGREAGMADLVPGLGEETLRRTYEAFNAREIDAVLAMMQPDVEWPNGLDGGYVTGHEAVREYWKMQWASIDPHVEPLSFALRDDGRIAIEVRLTVRDVEGKIISDGPVRHVYTMRDGLVAHMEIVKV